MPEPTSTTHDIWQIARENLDTRLPVGSSTPWSTGSRHGLAALLCEGAVGWDAAIDRALGRDDDLSCLLTLCIHQFAYRLSCPNGQPHQVSDDQPDQPQFDGNQ